MMYNEKVVASIKVKGKILREFKDTIYIPFGEEYSVLLKNLNTKRVIINVFIDSENVVPGGLVLNAGQTIDLERSIKNNNLHAGNKFKFIERTAAIEDGPRGIKLEDGLIRVEYQFEKAYPTINDYLGDLNKFKQDYPYPKTTQFFGQIARSVDSPLRNTTGEPYMQQYYATNNVAQFGATSAQASIMNTALNDVGITVPGSKSTQQYPGPEFPFSLSSPADFANVNDLTAAQQNSLGTYMGVCLVGNNSRIQPNETGFCYIGNQKSDGFDAASLNITASASTSMQDCQKSEPSGPDGGLTQAKQTTINGIIFYEAQLGEAATGHFVSTDSYRTYHGGACYTIDLNIESDVGTLEKGLSSDFSSMMHAKLKSILSTLKFTN